MNVYKYIMDERWRTDEIRDFFHHILIINKSPNLPNNINEWNVVCCYCTAAEPSTDATSIVEYGKIKNRIVKAYRAIAPKKFAKVNYEFF